MQKVDICVCFLLFFFLHEDEEEMNSKIFKVKKKKQPFWSE